MIIIRTKYLPLGDYSAINLLGMLFVHPGIRLSPVLINHERIHTRQMLELLIVPFYLLYVAEWLVRTISCRNSKQGYFNTSFEREAYANEHDLNYLQHRPLMAWTRYLRKKNK